MKLLGFDRVLCLSPHPDDVEYAMSGTVLKYCHTFFDVVCLSMGSVGDLSSSLGRYNEVRTFWQDVPNVELFFSDVAHLSGRGEEDWLKYIERAFVDIRGYDALFTPPYEDSHFEHRFTFHLSFAIVRKQPISVISYCIPSTLNSWTPNVLVDIGGQLAQKLQRLKVFNSQDRRPYFREEVLAAFHANCQAAKKGMNAVEKFHVHEVFA